ncbi:hypothetical protein RJ640_003585 [Escallonia rubra]|uniref:Ribulose bisphosphate carboxylase large subunit C-terminal domain-containing protein n=1 Tax=Escallonia rubra TaxID=112253 RepID=A0AA88QMP3_9ASTE|nr:hypothetical protein RJ640_003585 [Escallonia rubra]
MVNAAIGKRELFKSYARKNSGSHAWHMRGVTDIFWDDPIQQFGRETLGHPRGNAPGVIANRVSVLLASESLKSYKLASEYDALVKDVQNLKEIEFVPTYIGFILKADKKQIQRLGLMFPFGQGSQLCGAATIFFLEA